MEDYSKIVDVSATATAKGAKDSKIIKTDRVIVGEWVYWKCRFGCSTYGNNLTCPPHSPNPEQTKALLREYEYALLLKYDSTQDYNNLLIGLEREAFLRGFYKALSLTAGSCKLCENCNISNGCVNLKKARPSMEACGIDVFGTMHNVGFDMKVLTSKDEIYPRICLLLLQ
jgi:predicted metal-binding protein